MRKPKKPSRRLLRAVKEYRIEAMFRALLRGEVGDWTTRIAIARMILAVRSTPSFAFNGEAQKLFAWLWAFATKRVEDEREQRVP